MNIVDSSGWLEYFLGGSNSEKFSPPLQEPSSLIVPVITVYEVFKVALRESGENEALQAVAAMQKGTSHEHFAAGRVASLHRLRILRRGLPGRHNAAPALAVPGEGFAGRSPGGGSSNLHQVWALLVRVSVED